jgi:hypothetical protein
MNTDLYTKAVLTVIALCLVWMCVNGVTPVAQAQAQAQAQAKSAQPPAPTPVVLVNEKGVPIYTSQGLRVSLVNEQGTPVYTTSGLRVNLGADALPVVVSNPALPVSVRAIQQGTTWDPILVQLLRDPPTLRPVP